jgi:zinc D-Ala-D-Ala carboxypeptidase
MKKKLLLAFGIAFIFLLSGCNQLDNLINKIPFVNQEDGFHETNTEKKVKEEETMSEPTLESHFFNEIEEVDGKSIIRNPLNILALVNKQYALPDNYAPEDLMRPDVPFSFGDLDIEKSYLRKEASMHLELLFEAAERDGIEIFAVSGYRSYERQTNVFDRKANQVGQAAAAAVVAVPGYSEHQTGLAMDISSRGVRLELVEQFGETDEGVWLVENAHKFGYILRYPEGKESITGYQYEPWHFRYVGVSAATVIYEKQITLEEYFNIVEKI